MTYQSSKKTKEKKITERFAISGLFVYSCQLFMLSWMIFFNFNFSRLDKQSCHWWSIDWKVANQCGLVAEDLMDHESFFIHHSLFSSLMRLHLKNAFILNIVSCEKKTYKITKKSNTFVRIFQVWRGFLCRTG